MRAKRVEGITRVVYSVSEKTAWKMDDSAKGICGECGRITAPNTVEPDAKGYDCPSCKAPAVMGVFVALMSGKLVLRG